MNMNIDDIKTPYFLIHKDKMDNLIDDMFYSLQKYWKNGIVGYSFKTNNLPWIIKYMKKRGLYAEVVSSDEFELAVHLGFPYENIIFNGPVKGKKEFEEALRQNTIINLDSKRELRWLKECKDIKAKVGLRVNFDLEKICPLETQCGINDGRFGFSYETGEFEEALNNLKQSGIQLSGIHLHCSSKTRSLNIYKAIAEMTVRIIKQYDLHLEYVDIGGGFFGGVSRKPSFEDYFSSVKKIFGQDRRLDKTNIIIEPGMSIVGAAIDYVATVTDVKSTQHNRFIVTDGSRIHIDPLMRKSGYNYSIVYKNNLDNPEVLNEKQTLCGFTCMENDRFFSLDKHRSFKEGDQIIFQKVGAYTIGLSPLFIQFFPDVYVNIESEFRLVRRKWTAEKFLQDLLRSNE